MMSAERTVKSASFPTAIAPLLRHQFETTVVPGHFFEAPQHFRIGIGGPTDALEQGLARISTALKTGIKRVRAR
jgi:hypothetical protein